MNEEKVNSEQKKFQKKNVNKSPKSAPHKRVLLKPEDKSNSHRPGTVDPNITNEDRGYINTIFTWDRNISNTLAVCANEKSSLGFLRPVMKCLEYSCHGIPWIFGNLVVLLSTHRPEVIEDGVNLLVVLLMDLVIVGLVKSIFRRKRPSENEDDMFGTVSIDKYSFPSGHTTRAMMLLFFFFLKCTMGPLVNSVVMVWSLSVASSRVLLGRHHVLDVFAGCVIGIVEYYIIVYVWISRETSMKVFDLIHEELHY